MGSRSKELVVFAIDVSSPMKPFLKPISRSLVSFVQSQILHKHENEIGFLLFGTVETDNLLNDDMRKQRKKGQYMHITEIHPLQLPGFDTLACVDTLQSENGNVDYIDALTVAIDVIKKRTEALIDPEKYTKNVFIISDFASQVRPASPDFAKSLSIMINNLDIKLQMIAVDVEPVKKEMPDMESLLGLSEKTLQIRSVKTELELCSLFPAKPVSSICMYSGALEMDQHTNIPVKVYKKTGKLMPPSLKPYSDLKQKGAATHAVHREVEHKKVDDPSEPVDPSFHIRGYNYGSEFIPIPQDIEKSSLFVPTKGIRLIGFVHQDQIPRFHYMKDTFILLPSMNEEAQVALSALVEACVRSKKRAVVHCNLRRGSNLFLGILTPFIDRERHPDAFLMNVVPFTEDVRDFTFGSFGTKESLKPNEKQLEIMSQIVEQEGMIRFMDRETLYSDKAANPIIHRFYRLLGGRSLEAAEEDPLYRNVFSLKSDPNSKGLREVLTSATGEFEIKKEPDVKASSS